MLHNPLKNLERHRQMAALLYKYGRTDIVQNPGLAEQLSGAGGNGPDSEKTASHDWSVGDKRTDRISGIANCDPTPEELARDLEEMGPTFIKLGQLLSTRPDFLPEPYLKALTRLQDDADPIATRDIFRAIEEELGGQPETLFTSFEVEPLATASLGQVHRATTLDGREVVVKVQRPGVREVLNNDIEAMEELASVCEKFQFGRQYQPKHMVESLKQSLSQEISYLSEARNSKMLASNLCDFENIIVPDVIESLSTDKVITSEFVDCEKITEMKIGRVTKQDAKRLASELFASFLHQVLVHGAFHADPHPGNVALTKGGKIVLMDYGLVVKVAPGLQGNLIKLLLAICDADGEQAAEIAESIGVVGENFDSGSFHRDIAKLVAENVNQSVDQMDAGTALMQIQLAAGKNNLTLPQEVILLGRALMHLERVVSALNPEFDPNQAIREQSMLIMQQHSTQKFSMASVFQSFIESTDFAQQLPARANKLAELVTNNELEFKVNTIDENKFINGMNKIANRITAGIIIAAMIVGASLMIRSGSAYETVAFCFFIAAAMAGSILVWRAVISDKTSF